MDIKELRKLIEFISRSEFTEFEMEQEGFRLKLSRASLAPPAPVAAPAPNPVTAPVPPPPPAPAAAPPAPAAAEEGPRPTPAADAGVVELRSPIVGTFYRSPSPEAPSFVQVGDRVEVGQVLCIVEAMKVMNEIQAEQAGEIVEVLPKNNQPVEFDEVLFRIRALD